MAKGHNSQDQVEETQDGAEQPQTQPDTMEQLAAETVATEEPVTEPVVETPQVVEPVTEATAQPALGTPVAEVKRTPSVIADVNKAKAVEYRQLYAADFERIGNNMSEKIRFLTDEGLSKGDISRVLQIQFQFVRNVVFNYDMKKAKLAEQAAAEAAKAQAPAS